MSSSPYMLPEKAPPHKIHLYSLPWNCLWLTPSLRGACSQRMSGFDKEPCSICPESHTDCSFATCMFKLGKDVLESILFYFTFIDGTPWPFPDVEIVNFFFP